MGDGQGMSTTKKVLIGVGIVAVGILAYSLLSEEPPIRVKGGSLDIEIYSGGTESWGDAGNDWRLKSSGTNASGKYNFTIVVGNYCTSSGTPPSIVKELTIELAGRRVTIKPRGVVAKTMITPKGDFSSVPNNPKVVANPNSGAVKITVKPGYGTANEWSCTFPEGTFQELCLYKSQCS